MKKRIIETKTKMKKITSDFIPIKPISVNKCFQGRRFRTTFYKQWQDAVNLALPKEKMVNGKIAVFLYFYYKLVSKFDIDNSVKAVLDSLVKKKLIEDDRFIYFLQVQKEESQIEGFKFQILKL